MPHAKFRLAMRREMALAAALFLVWKTYQLDFHALEAARDPARSVKSNRTMRTPRVNATTLRVKLECNHNTNNSTTLTTTSASKKDVPILTLSKSQHLFLHHGKSGGGTLNHRFSKTWRINLGICHPFPCPEVFFNPSFPATSSTLKKRKNTNFSGKNLKSLIISIRDPIDRFVSAFFWRTLTLCNPFDDQDKRIVTEGGDASNYPSDYCFLPGKFGLKKEADLLFRKYDKNISRFAEALCTADGRLDRHNIKHMNTLSEWLNNDDETGDHYGNHSTWRNKVQQLIPVVLEKGFEYNNQVDHAIQWMQDTHQLFTQDAFQARRNRVRSLDSPLADCQEEQLQHDTTITGDNTGTDSSSSSTPASSSSSADSSVVAHQHASSRYVKNAASQLSKRGGLCLAKLYSKDYHLLADLKEEACKFEACKTAIQSILDRRRDLLQQASDTV